MTESAQNGNGFRIRGWRDLSAVLTIMGMIFGFVTGVIVWGIKLDNRLSELSTRVTRLETRTDARPDAFTSSDGEALERRIEDLEGR